MKIFSSLYILLFLLITVSTPIVAQTQGAPTMYEAVVKHIAVSQENNGITNSPIKKVQVELVTGDLKGKTIVIEDNTVPTAHPLEYKEGDHVMVAYAKGPQNTNIAYITDYVRRGPMLLLFLIFLVLIFSIARWQGVTSLIGMAISFLVIGTFIVPNIILGNDPLMITLFGAVFIVPITYYLAHGFNKKTTIAILGTFIALVLTGLFAYGFIELTKLSGFSSDEAVYLQTLGIPINIKSLLLSGIIIGILAVLNDITISQASVVHSIHKSKPTAGVKELYQSTMSVGRDHIASLVNTLVLVYAGASLPLFVLFSASHGSLSLVINQEIIATEVVRTLVSSIGIVAAVPITTYLAALAYKKKIL